MADVDLQKAKKISIRDWHTIRERWIDHVPTFASPGIPPELELCELPSVDERLNLEKKQTVTIKDNLPGLRQGVLHEGIYLFHKAAHIFGASLLHVESGLCTWSLSSAYQSAYFAMKSILCLLGVSIVDSQTRGIFLVDVWHTEDRHQKRQKDPIVFMYNSGKIEHGQLWACFQRAVDVTSNHESICAASFRRGLLGVEPNEFADQRNRLHYKNVWRFGDLHAALIQNQFGRITSGELDSEQDDFLVVLAFGLIHMGRHMLGELAKSSAPIQEETALVDTWLNQPFNRLYGENSAVMNSTLVTEI